MVWCMQLPTATIRKEGAKKTDIKIIILCGFNGKIRKLQKEHQQAIEQKYEALALFNNDIQDRHKQIQVSKYENVGS